MSNELASPTTRSEGPPAAAPRRRTSRWAVRVGSLWGIDIDVHATLVVLLLWMAVARWIADHDLVGMVTTVGFMAALFFCILLHELGHAMAARKLGIRTLRITLSPVGGIASLERLPEEPRHELLIALAGPAVSVALALVFGALAWLSKGIIVTSAVIPATGGAFLAALAMLNGTLVLFNMLPALPLDGGRVLRAVLAMRMSFMQATELAATLARVVALLLAIAGMFWNPMLIVVAYFVWVGAMQESTSARARAVLRGLPVRAAMATRIAVLRPEDPLSTAAALVVDGLQGVFPVVSGVGPVGVLALADVVRGLAERGPAAPIEAVMNRRFSVVAPDASLEQALTSDESNDGTLIVVRSGVVLGVVTAESLGELVLLKSAMRSFAEAHRSADSAGSIVPRAASAPPG